MTKYAYDDKLTYPTIFNMTEDLVTLCLCRLNFFGKKIKHLCGPSPQEAWCARHLHYSESSYVAFEHQGKRERERAREEWGG